MGESVEGVGRKFLPVTAGVVGLGTAAVKTAADFDSAMSKVAAVSRATGSDFDALRDKAREMGSKTKFSASEAAEAMNYMAMAGWKTKDMLGGIEGVINLAAASGEDLATTSDIVTDALTAFGLTAQDSGHFADVLAAAIGPVLIVIGKIMSAVGTIMIIIPKLASVIGIVQKAFMALNATMLASPIVLIIAAIAALVAAFV